ncbi:S4 domain-containing protein [Sphingosinithalassobacter sp. LHW66-3]|uniref:S4 domain-containing protein n=1 Tax=Sphingosinithalassobacter sp. LHW66-3 TaxID=3424718 RepID=UPI003D6B85AA
MADRRPDATMRLDRFLWWSRISASRTYARALAEGGRLRINGRRVDRAHVPVRVGDILAFVTHLGKVRVVRIEALPARRGPPAEAAALYTPLETLASKAVDAPGADA